TGRQDRLPRFTTSNRQFRRFARCDDEKGNGISGRTFRAAARRIGKQAALMPAFHPALWRGHSTRTARSDAPTDPDIV
ncbi:MAG TPA: hypothetical protein VGK80_01330, partial [Rhodanobacteraceae bacterium]